MKELALADRDWAEALKRENAYDYIADVQLQHDSASLINSDSTCKHHLAMSVSTHESGWPRVIVGADKAGKLICRSHKCCSMPGIKRRCCHCKKVCEWQKTVDAEVSMLEATGDDTARQGRLTILAAGLKGYQLLSTAQSH